MELAGARSHDHHSMADGVERCIGEDAVDFDLQLQDVRADTATLLVRHVAPKKRFIQTPADWMKESVTPGIENNWAQVVKAPGETPVFVARVGHETFDVTIKRVLSLLGGLTGREGWTVRCAD